MYRYFTHANPRQCVDVLDDLLHLYNNTYHCSTRMAPAKINVHNEQQVRKSFYPLKPKSYRWKYKVGDIMRIVL